MLIISIPKLMQDANEVRQALEKIRNWLPDEISATELEAKLAALETAVNDLNALNIQKDAAGQGRMT